MKKISIHQERERVIFASGPDVAGEYVIGDRFKPYLHPLRTPAGHVVTVAMPGDHRHHKGLMYGLRCADLNFWEEDPGSGQCGVQEVLDTEISAVGVCQQILWREEGGSLETYREEREISCAIREDGTAFDWTWISRRKALRDHRLIKSEWSLEVPDGRAINYHGLGIRLPWLWAFGGDEARAFSGVDAGDRPSTPMSACGANGPKVTWWGGIDGHWSPPLAAVTLKQKQRDTWFLIKGDFPYLAVGPSNLEELEVAAGDTFEEHFTITVEDRQKTSRRSE
ncbi:MAG: DUF6807 family protein [Verrucomicrobiota bacterium]